MHRDGSTPFSCPLCGSPLRQLQSLLYACANKHSFTAGEVLTGLADGAVHNLGRPFVGAELKEKAENILLRAALDCSPNFIQIFKAVRNGQGDIIDFIWVLQNHVSIKASGNVVGRSMLRENPGTMASGIFDRFVRVCSSGVAEQVDLPYFHEQFHHWFHQCVVKMDDGIAATSTDITERKLLEEELRSGHDLLYGIAEIVSDIVCVQEYPSLHMLYSNELCNGSLGYRLEAALNPNLRADDMVIHPDCVDDLVGYWRRFERMDDGETATLECWLRSRDAGWRWLVIRGKVFARDHAGVPVKILSVIEDRTIQKQAADDALRLNEASALDDSRRYNQMYNAIDEAFCQIELVFDADGDAVDYEYVHVNPAFYLQTGMNDVVGKRVRELMPDIDPMLLFSYAKALSGSPQRFDHHAPELGKWFSIYAAPAHNPESKQVLVLFKEITRQKRLEQELLASEEAFHSFVTASSDIVFKVGATWQTMYQLEGKDFLASLTGSTEEWIDQYIPSDAQELFRAEIARAIAGGKMFDLEHKVINDEGKLSWAHTRAVPQYGHEGQLISWIGAIADITTRKASEETMRENQRCLEILEERYRTALEAAEMSAWDFDVVRGRIAWNDQHYAALGLKPDGLYKTPEESFSFLHLEDVKEAESAMVAALAGNAAYHQEFRIIRADNGDVRWMSSFGRVVDRDGDGKATRMVGVMYDITGDREKDLLQKEFIATASHELKTPVTAIVTYVDVLQEHLEDENNEVGAGLMKKMSTQVERLVKLINYLLDTTRITNGNLLLQAGRFDLYALIKARVEEVQHTTNTHRVSFEADGDGAEIDGDGERIGQVIVNLLGNAIKFSPDATDVTVMAKQGGNIVTVSVIDKGRGIAQEDVEKVFDRFFRGKDARVQSYAGLGLGLFISATIVRQHGGTISVHSKEGVGSVFSFTLPMFDV